MKNRLPRLPRGQRRCRSCLGVFPTGARAIVYCQECREHPNPGATANSVSCCRHCNFAKRRMSVSEFLDWVSKVFRYNARSVDFTREFAGLLGGY